LVPAGFGQSATKSVDGTQLMAWRAGGISNRRLGRLVERCGINFAATEEYKKALRAAGADKELIHTLQRLSADGKGSQPTWPVSLAKAAELANRQRYAEAEHELRDLLRSEPQNAALHFALGHALRQQEEWDEAFDEFSESEHLMPGLADTHARLAYLF